MRRAAALALVSCLVLAGCVAGPGTPTTDSLAADTPTPTATPTPPAAQTDTSTTAQSATARTTASPTPGENVSVEYVVRADALPDHVSHLRVDFGGVYFAERSDDVISCAGTEPLMNNKYEPTPTPLPTPAAACHGTDAPSVTLAEGDGPQSLGTYEAAGNFDGGYMVVVRDIGVVLENGTEAEDVYDTDFRAHVGRSAASGAEGIAFSVAYEPNEEIWDYTVEVDHFEPAT